MPPRYGRKRRHFWRSGIIERDRTGAARRKSKRRTGAKMESYLGESSGQSPRRTPVMPTSPRVRVDACLSPFPPKPGPALDHGSSTPKVERISEHHRPQRVSGSDRDGATGSTTRGSRCNPFGISGRAQYASTQERFWALLSTHPRRNAEQLRHPSR